MALNIFQAGMDIKLQVTTQVDNVNTTPDQGAPTVSVYGPDGAADVTDAEMTNSALGVHYYWFSDPTAVGVYRWEVNASHAVDGAARETIAESRFIVQ